MPVTKLKADARKAGLKAGTKRWRAYVYGTEALIKKRRAAKRKKSRGTRKR